MQPEYESAFPPEVYEHLSKLITLLSENLLPRFKELAALTDLNEEEMEEFNQLRSTLEEITPTVQLAFQILGTKLTNTSSDLFFHFRSLAMQGNEEAQKAYEELQPLYQDMMKEGLDGNSN